LLPVFTEQGIFSRKVQDLGAGFSVPLQQGKQIIAKLDGLLTNSTCRSNAQSFAQRYATFSAGDQIPEIVEHLEKLLNTRS